MPVTLATCANQVLQEFGGAIPENIIGFEDAMREFLQVRALELQKLGIAGTDKILTTGTALSPTTRDAELPGSFGNIVPAFVKFRYTSDTLAQDEKEVEIVPIETIAENEGNRTIAFYGIPMRYKLSWDAWQEGEIYIWSNVVEDLTDQTSATNMTFPPAFWTYLYKKTAYQLIKIALLKIARMLPSDSTLTSTQAALEGMKSDLAVEVIEWRTEFRKYKNLDLNAQPRMRRSVEELWDRDINVVSSGYY